MHPSTFGRLSWTPLTPFGARVEANLSTPLSPEEQAQLRSLLWEHEVLVVSHQRLTHERQIEIMEYIAKVQHNAEGAHFISTEREKGVLGKQELPFHSDASFLPKLRKALSLHAIDVPDGKTSTRFVSASRAAAALPQALRRRLEGLTCLHTYRLDKYGPGRPTATEIPDWLPRHSHPVLLPHHATGKLILYVQQLHSARIDQLPPAQSQALLDELMSYLYAPDNVLEHVWYNGDFVIWDNIATQHARGALHASGPRTLQKVQTSDATFQEQWPLYQARELQDALRALSEDGAT